MTFVGIDQVKNVPLRLAQRGHHPVGVCDRDPGIVRPLPNEQRSADGVYVVEG